MTFPHISDAWTNNRSVFAQAILPGCGFSFRYDGRTVGTAFTDDWKIVAPQDRRDGWSRVEAVHGSGLKVTRSLRIYPDFKAAEFSLAFENVGPNKLPPISALHALNMSFGKQLHKSCVISSGGGLYDSFYPPRTFAIRKNSFSPSVPNVGKVELTTDGGRSSNKDLPFWFVHNEEHHEGLFAAFGWTGQWGALVMCDPGADALTLKGRIPEVNICLEPGEKLEGPSVLVGLYQGALADGSNQLRRLIRDEFTPKLAGQQFLPMAMYDHWFDVGEDFDEALLKKLADAAAEVGQEYFLLDAAWYAGAIADNAGGFSAGLGNWNQVDTTKLPNGLAAVAQHVRAKGLKFGLWFEPERVAAGSWLAKEHPDWILWDHGKMTSAWSWMIENNPEMKWLDRRYGLLDYSRVEVQEWARAMMDRYLSEHDIRYVRHDFNLEPLPYWEANETADRKGALQMRHIRGLYAVIDWLRARHPNTVFEGCASGGRRIDLETARRFHTFLISDHVADPAIMRFHLFGINHFLPGNYHWVAYTLPTPLQKQFEPDDLGAQSLFGGAFGASGRVDRWSGEMRAFMRRHVEVWKTLRRYLIEDYYPLTAQPDSLTSWSGWQFHDPQDQSGFMQTFRTDTADATHRFFPRGLDEAGRYRFTDAYSAASFELIGGQAMSQGIEVTQDAMSSRVFKYKRA